MAVFVRLKVELRYILTYIHRKMFLKTFIVMTEIMVMDKRQSLDEDWIMGQRGEFTRLCILHRLIKEMTKTV